MNLSTTIVARYGRVVCARSFETQSDFESRLMGRSGNGRSAGDRVPPVVATRRSRKNVRGIRVRANGFARI